MDLQVRRDFQVLRGLLDQGVRMGRKADGANQEYQKYQVHLVFVVTWVIQAWEVKRDPPLLGPRAFPGHLE